MACGDTGLSEALGDIALALRYMADKQASSGCGCGGAVGGGGSAGAGASQPPLTPAIPSDPEVDPPPEGFETWEEYKAYKCAIANDIIQTLAEDLGEMAIYTFGGITLEGLATLITITIATPIPFDDIIVIAGLLLTVAAEIVITTCISIINDDHDNLVCALYMGVDSGSSRDLFLGEFNTFIDGVVADPIEKYAAETLMAYMMGASVTNRLYNKDNTRNFPSADCSECECNTSGEASFQVVSGGDWGSGDLTINCEQRTLSSTLYTQAAYYFIGIENTGANDILVTAISADPGLFNDGSFGGLSGLGDFTLFPGNIVSWGGNLVPFTMEVVITGLDTVNGS